MCSICFDEPPKPMPPAFPIIPCVLVLWRHLKDRTQVLYLFSMAAQAWPVTTYIVCVNYKVQSSMFRLLACKYVAHFPFSKLRFLVNANRLCTDVFSSYTEKNKTLQSNLHFLDIGKTVVKFGSSRAKLHIRPHILSLSLSRDVIDWHRCIGNRLLRRGLSATEIWLSTWSKIF